MEIQRALWYPAMSSSSIAAQGVGMQGSEGAVLYRVNMLICVCCTPGHTQEKTTHSLTEEKRGPPAMSKKQSEKCFSDQQKMAVN